MSDIKLRVWDIIGKRMLEVREVTFLVGGGVHIQAWYPSNNCGGENIAELSDGEHELMQYTGLKDKNGKEIYEGDLFHCMYHSDGHVDHLYEVVYIAESTGFFLKRHGNACPQVYVRQTVSDHSGWRGEVIGNIYENLELISKS